MRGCGKLVAGKFYCGMVESRMIPLCMDCVHVDKDGFVTEVVKRPSATAKEAAEYWLGIRKVHLQKEASEYT